MRPQLDLAKIAKVTNSTPDAITPELTILVSTKGRRNWVDKGANDAGNGVVAECGSFNLIVLELNPDTQ